jgi:hypothetical protein
MDEFDKKVARMPEPTLLGTDDLSISRTNSSKTIVAEPINSEVNHHLQKPPGLPSIQPEAREDQTKPPARDLPSVPVAEDGLGGAQPIKRFSSLPNTRRSSTHTHQGPTAAVLNNNTVANPSQGNSNNRSKEEEAGLTKRLEALKPPDHDGQSQQRGGAGGPSPGGAANAAGGMPNSHGSVPGGGSRLPPLKPKVSEEARKSQNALSDGVAGVVNSPKGSAETPPADNGNKTLARYDAGKALNLKKNVDNMNRAFAEGADEVADASLENHSPAGIEQGKGNDLPSSESVLPGKEPTPPAGSVPLARSKTRRNLHETSKFIRHEPGGNGSAGDSQGSGRQAARVAFQEKPSSPNAASQEKSKINPENEMGTGAAAAQASDQKEAHFEKGRGVRENEGMADGTRVEEYSDSE